MKNRFMTMVFSGLVAATALSTPVFAQTVGTPGTVDPGHPRINEVDQRIENQENRTNAGVADGQIKPGQAGRDEARDARVEQKAQKDEAKHGGHLTKREKHHLNKKLNKNSKDIHRQRTDGVK